MPGVDTRCSDFAALSATSPSVAIRLLRRSPVN